MYNGELCPEGCLRAAWRCVRANARTPAAAHAADTCSRFCPALLLFRVAGHVFLWNYNTQSLVKSFEVCDQPVRCGKFVPRKQWIVAGADDMSIRVYNYNTMEKVKTFEAHSDYIR